MESVTGYICKTAILWDEGQNFRQELPLHIREISLLPFEMWHIASLLGEKKRETLYL